MSNSIYGICRKILKVTDAEIEELRLMAQEQLIYTHPLKMGTAANQHRLGSHNIAMLDLIVKMRDAMKANVP